MIRILHIDDDPDSRNQLKWWLSHASETIEVRSAESASQAMRELERSEFNCIISDLDMPGTDGLELLKTLRSSGQDTPFMILSNFNDEENVEAAMRAGVDVYCTKDEAFTANHHLLSCIEHAIEARLQSQEGSEYPEDSIELQDDTPEEAVDFARPHRRYR